VGCPPKRTTKAKDFRGEKSWKTLVGNTGKFAKRITKGSKAPRSERKKLIIKVKPRKGKWGTRAQRLLLKRKGKAVIYEGQI